MKTLLNLLDIQFKLTSQKHKYTAQSSTLHVMLKNLSVNQLILSALKCKILIQFKKQTNIENSESHWHHYCRARCQAKCRIWALVRSCDDQRIVSVADLVVQLLYGCNPPLNAHTCTSHTEGSCLVLWGGGLQLLVTLQYNSSHRDAVYMKGLDQVAVSDSISQGAVQTLIWVDCCHCGDGGAHCVRSLAQHCDILLLRKLWGVIVLIHNVNVDGGWGLREKETDTDNVCFTSCICISWACKSA